MLTVWLCSGLHFVAQRWFWWLTSCAVSSGSNIGEKFVRLFVPTFSWNINKKLFCHKTLKGSFEQEMVKFKCPFFVKIGYRTLITLIRLWSHNSCYIFEHDCILFCLAQFEHFPLVNVVCICSFFITWLLLLLVWLNFGCCNIVF